MRDEELLAAFARGDRAALGELASRHEPALLGLCLGLLGSRSLACDAVQETWVRVIRFAPRFRGRSSVKTWLYRIAINRCRELLAERRRPVRAAAPLGDDEPAGAEDAHGADLRERDEELRRAVMALDERRRVIVLLCYQNGMTHELAAEILGLPLGTLKSRLHGALGELRRRLAAKEVA